MKIRVIIIKVLAWLLRVPLNQLTIVPIHKVKTLRDEPGRAHVWLLDPKTSTEDDRVTLAEAITGGYIRYYGKEPKSLHLVVRNVEELRVLNRQDARAWLRPWLESEKQKGGK